MDADIHHLETQARRIRGRVIDMCHDAHAPLFGCAVTTGFGVIANNARLKIGESIVVLGAEGVCS